MVSPCPRPRDVALRTADGHSLAASAWEPECLPRGAVLINSATGVKRGFYAPFASFLAERGLLVLSFDYRGIGGSRPGSLALCDARMRDWGQQDAEAALQWLLERTPRVALVGHSFGGQALGLMPGASRLQAALLVAAQSGYWRHWRGLHRLGLWALWHLLIPGLCTACGYFPGRVLGSAQDLPSGVAREWARWGRFPGYVADDEGGALAAGFAGLTLPIRALSSRTTTSPRRLRSTACCACTRRQSASTSICTRARWVARSATGASSASAAASRCGSTRRAGWRSGWASATDARLPGLRRAGLPLASPRSSC